MRTLRNRHLGVIGAAFCALAIAGTAHGQWTTSGNDAYFNLSGNVGIGITSPLFNLHVVESATSDGTRAIYGLASGTSGVTNGLYGSTASVAGRGVIGLATATTGTNFGLYGQSSSVDGRGVYGLAPATTGSNFGVFGRSDSTSGTATAGWSTATSGSTVGVEGQSDSTGGIGVWGVATANTGYTSYGVYGQSAQNGYGVYGISGGGGGVYGISTNGNGVYGQSSTGYAVYANGAFGASGTKSFCIDHPGDPANKYLLHYSIESSEVLNSYSGKIGLDALGCAIVELPAYFANVNTDPRYTLTAVGAPMPLLHISQEISEAALLAGAKAAPSEAPSMCWFRIGGGVPGGKVSWRIEAVRNDRWVQVHGAPVEVVKRGADRGTYLQPDLFGMPREMGTYYCQPPETATMRRVEK